MNTVDLAALVAALDPDGRGGRRQVDEVATALRPQVQHVDAAAMPQLVRDTIRRGEQQGLWSATRKAVRRGRTTLPKSVLLPPGGRAAEKLLPLHVPLRDELASWASPLRLSTAQRQMLMAVNDWLRRTGGGQVPIAAAAERIRAPRRREGVQFVTAARRNNAVALGPVDV